MNYTESVAYLDSCIGLGRKFGLEPMRSVMSRMGDPQDRCRSIHVAGTNGKTSTSRMAGRVLLTQGYSAGVFISPHLQTVEERIAVNGREPHPGPILRRPYPRWPMWLPRRWRTAAVRSPTSS